MTEETLYQAIRSISRKVRNMLVSDDDATRERGWRIVAAVIVTKLA